MPNTEMLLVRVVKNEGRGDEPDPARQLGDLVPPPQADYFQLREREHSESNHSRVQNDGWDSRVIVKPWRETNRDAQQET